MSTDAPLVKLGYEEYCLFPDDGNRHEVINGRHYMNPAPTPNHQTVSKRLQHFLYTQIELAGLGTVFDAPIDVQLGEHDIVQPDLVVILKTRRAKITRTRVIGPPDLLVEILSPSSSRNDQTLKLTLYEQVGVLEYWIVDPEDYRVRQLVLKDGKYAESPASESELRLAILPEVAIPLDQVWYGHEGKRSDST